MQFIFLTVFSIMAGLMSWNGIDWLFQDALSAGAFGGTNSIAEVIREENIKISEMMNIQGEYFTTLEPPSVN